MVEGDLGLEEVEVEDGTEVAGEEEEAGEDKMVGGGGDVISSS